MSPEQSGSKIVDANLAKYAIEEKRMYLEAGILGKVFGTSSNAPRNVAGLFVFILTLTWVWLALHLEQDRAEAFLKMVTPLLTLALGYMFGRGGQ